VDYSPNFLKVVRVREVPSSYSSTRARVQMENSKGSELGGLKLRSTWLLSMRSEVSQIRNRCHIVDLTVFPLCVIQRKIKYFELPQRQIVHTHYLGAMHRQFSSGIDEKL
jgi:hypothetical protein